MANAGDVSSNSQRRKGQRHNAYFITIRKELLQIQEKVASKLERHKETLESTIWLEVQTLKDRMSQLYSVLA